MESQEKKPYAAPQITEVDCRLLYHGADPTVTRVTPIDTDPEDPFA